MRLVNALTAGIIGIVVAATTTILPLTFPAFSIGGGAVVAAGVLLVGRRSGQKRYAGTGAVYTLGLAAAIYATGIFPAEFAESPLIALVALGSISGAIAAFSELVGLVARGVGGETAEKIVRTIAAVLGLVAIIWTVLTAYEKAIRYAGVGVGSSAGFVFDFVGIELPIPLVLIDGSVDASMVLFVGGVLIGFHTLDTIHNGWRASKLAAVKGARAGKKGASAAQQRVSDAPSEEN